MSRGVLIQLEVFVSNSPRVCRFRYAASVNNSRPIAAAIATALSFGLLSFRVSSASRS